MDITQFIKNIGRKSYAGTYYFCSDWNLFHLDGIFTYHGFHIKKEAVSAIFYDACHNDTYCL